MNLVEYNQKQHNLLVVAKAITYSEELTGTTTGDYLKFLLDQMRSSESYYSGQLENAVIEAEAQVNFNK